MDGLYHIVYFTIMDILRTFISPFFILIVIIIFSQYYKTVNSPIKAIMTSIIFGTFGGIIGTVVFTYLRIYLIPKDFIYIFSVAMILSLINPRLVCFAYGGSIVVLSNLIVGYPNINSYKIMKVVAILHLIESLLILINGGSQRQRDSFNVDGELFAGYTFNRFWPLPLVIFIGDTMIRPITLLAILNYQDFTLSNSPKTKTITTSISICIYSIILLKISLLRINPFLAPIFAIVGHEFIIGINKYREKKSLRKKKLS